MRQGVTRAVYHFIVNPIGLGTIFLSVLMGVIALVLWFREISYIYPGPAWVVGGLALIILAIGGVLYDLQAKNNDLQVENTRLFQKANQLQEVNQGLVQNRDDLLTQTKTLIEERDRLLIEINKLIQEKNDLQAQNNDLIRERNKLRAEKNDLIRERESLETEKDDLLQQVSNLQTQNSDLEKKLTEFQERTESDNHSPRLIGLEFLVGRWQEFKPESKDSVILHEQITIAMSIARLHYSRYQEIRFIKAFAGAKIKGGAFLLETTPPAKPLVLKFDSLTNIEKEEKLYRTCVQEFLQHTSGAPWRPEQKIGLIEGEEWGAIAYSFIGGNASLTELGQLKTFAEYYLEHDQAHIKAALEAVFKTLTPWWENSVWPRVCAQTRHDTLFGEYNRLIRRRPDAELAIRKVGQKLQIAPLAGITSEQREVDLGMGLKLRNPFNWIQDVFAASSPPGWITNPNLRRDSIVHGDFHSGNILISQDDRQQIWAWLIDFPHTHVGPTVRDIARLEADIKFSLFPEKFLADHSIFETVLAFETEIVGNGKRESLDLSSRARPLTLAVSVEIEAELDKAWQALAVLRRPVRNEYLHRNDARPYYLALLHATLPMLYYRDRTPWQKFYAFISAALLCERLDRQTN
jgi:hypothetical protein